MAAEVAGRCAIALAACLIGKRLQKTPKMVNLSIHRILSEQPLAPLEGSQFLIVIASRQR
jgi:hypothetical protein